MKKLFATLLMLSNMFPALAYVRDDTDSGFGFLGGIVFFVIFIIGIIISLKNQDKN